MPEANPTVSQLSVLINGSSLSSEKMDLLQQAIVDQSVHLPHMFLLRFSDPDAKLIDESLFSPGNEVEISAQDEAGTSTTLIKGEITAIEPEFGEGMIVDMVVRGYDKLHRMYREVKSRAFENTKDSDMANEIAGEHGLSPQVDSTSTVYDHIYQHNQTDLAFLMQRAWRIGYECFVDEGKLYFRKPPNASGGTTLTWGQNLKEFQPSLSLAEQVSEVNVRGWDMKKQEAIVGRASNGHGFVSIGLGNPSALGDSFGTGKKTLVDLPVVSQAEANTLAQARLDESAGALVQASGSAFRMPAIRAGKAVQIENVGTRFSGNYLVTSARHVYESGGLDTEFEVTGANSGLLNEQLLHHQPMDRWPGVVVAKVTDNSDPDGLGRVKVVYPWMTEDASSCWARVISPGAGKEAGLFMIPDVGDEVIVAFEHGDFDRPYVLGGLWNGKYAVPPPGAGAAAGEKHKVRTWHSHTGHHISVYDNTDNKIEIITASGHMLTLDDMNKKIEVISAGGSKLVIDDQGQTVDLESKGQLNIKSALPMSIKSDATLTVEGKMVDIKSSGPLNLKGAVVNIN